MFRTEYLELDEFLASAQSLVALGDLVQLTRRTAATDNATWHVEPSGIKRRFPQDDESNREPLALPEEAILVSRRWFNKPSIRYWNSSIYRGIGSVSDNYFVLTSSERGSIAWLKKQLESPYVQLQLKRRAVGELAPLLTAEDFLDIRVQLPSIQAQSKDSREVIEETRHAVFSLRAGRIQQNIDLSDESHDERLKSLERMALELL